MTPAGALGCPQLLGAEQPPPGGLAPLVELQLDALRQLTAQLVTAQWRLVALDAGEQLAAAGYALQGGGQGRRRVTPGDQRAVCVAEGVTGLEATLGVIARGRRDTTEPKSLAGRLEHRRVGLGVAIGVEGKQRN